MTRLVLVRHGESVVTVDRVIGGPRSCTGLSPVGVKQAEALHDRLRRSGELDGDVVLIASILPRARETAEIIAPALGDIPVMEDPDLHEHDPGDADGLTFDEFVERYGSHWPDDPDARVFPNGETLGEFHARVTGALDRLVAEHAGRTLVVACHGGVIDRAVRGLLGLPVMGGFVLQPTNTSLTELIPAGDSWCLVRYNDAAHLA